MNYAMFTESGNQLVHSIVEMAKTFGLNDVQVLAMCSAVAKNNDFAEITDTAVRESIGEVLGWYE
jgi:hypothetical protein